MLPHTYTAPTDSKFVATNATVGGDSSKIDRPAWVYSNAQPVFKIAANKTLANRIPSKNFNLGRNSIPAHDEFDQRIENEARQPFGR